MKKKLLLIALFTANLQALPETMGSEQKPFSFIHDKKQELPEIPKRRSIKDLLTSKQEDNPSSLIAYKDSELTIERKTFIAKDYAHNKIIIKIRGIKTDSLVVASERGDDIPVNFLIIEDDHEKFAEIVIGRTNISSFLFSVCLENTPYQDICNEEVFGNCSYNDNFQVSYSKQQQTVTIIIPFNFTRKTLPINIIE